MIRHHEPLTLRILRYLDALQEPCHYLLLADVLQRPADTVQPACVHLAKDGRLARSERGHYTITAKGMAASRGGQW